MEELLAAIREEAGPKNWSRGVQLMRQDAVVGEKDAGGEVTLSVRADSGPKRFQVHLYVDDEDWSCSCPSTAPACEHVCAAVIALNQARKSGQALPKSLKAASTLVYAFSSASNELRFQRMILTGSTLEPLEVSLSAALGAREILSTDADLEIEALLGSRARGVLPRPVLLKLLPRLEGLDVRLDDQKIAVGRGHPGMRAVVEDSASGVRVRLEQSPEVQTLYRNGALVIGGALMPLLEPGLDGARIRALREGMLFEKERLGELVSSVLPELRGRIPLEIRARNLPETESSKPRIAFDVRQDGRSTQVMATIVYGDPAIARLDGDALVLLGSGRAPVRDRRAESALLTRMRAELQIDAGVRMTLSSTDAMQLGQRVEQSALRGAEAPALASLGALLPALDTTNGFNVNFSARGGARASADAVIEAWIAGEDHVPLIDGGFAELPHDWLGRYGQRVADLLMAKRDDGLLAPGAQLEAAALLEQTCDRRGGRDVELLE
ncbi:MAG: SWIM zinc finger family protein [Myxococcota bacterium]